MTKFMIWFLATGFILSIFDVFFGHIITNWWKKTKAHKVSLNFFKKIFNSDKEETR